MMPTEAANAALRLRRTGDRSMRRAFLSERRSRILPISARVLCRLRTRFDRWGGWIWLACAVETIGDFSFAGV